MSYAVGMNADANVSWQTFMSLTKMFNAFPTDFESRVIGVNGGCADFADSRNKMVRAFLSTDIDWLLVVDSDMVWEPTDWVQLRDSASDEAPFVAGTYFVDNDPPQPAAIIYNGGTPYHPVLKEDSPELQWVSAASIGFGLIHRDVFMKSADLVNDHEWFEHGVRDPNGKTLPEDWAWCSKVGGAGIPIYLNTKVRIGHLKPRILGWDDYVSANPGDSREVPNG